MRRRKLLAEGLDPEAAHHAALQQFGRIDDVRTRCISLDEERERTMKRVRYADELGQDISFAWRALRRNPGFAVVAVLTLALGIGANTAIFTLIDAIILQPIPVTAPSQLVAIGDPSRVNSMSNGSPISNLISYPLYRDIAARTRTLSGVVASGQTDRLDIKINPAAVLPDHPAGRFVSANYFSVLGVHAALGRVFGPADDVIGAAPVMVISDRYWSNELHRDPAVIGKTVLVNGQQFSVIGVMPPAFAGEVVGARYSLWLPLGMHDVLRPHDHPLADRNTSWLLLLGRRRAGVTEGQARTELKALIHTTLLEAATPDEAAELRTDTAIVGPGAHGFSRLRHNFARPLWIMLAGVALLLLIICANVANLLLARSLARTPEFAVRLAMGAGRSRLMRQLLTESAVLGLTGAAVGLLVAVGASRMLLMLAADGGGAAPLAISFDIRVLGFTLGISFLAVLCFGLLPSTRAARLDLASALRARGVTGRLDARGQRLPLGTAMISGQVALSLVLLMGASLLVRSLTSLETTDVGLDRDHILMATLETGERGYAGAQLMQLSLNVQRRLAAIPGVVGVSYSENGIFSGTESGNTVDVPGWPGGTSDDSNSAFDQIGPRYAAAIGAHVTAGRDFSDDDITASVARTALINESFAKFYFGKRAPVGQPIRMAGNQTVTVVGVIADVHDHALDEAPVRRFYLPFGSTMDHTVGSVNFEIRTRQDPAALTTAVLQAVRDEDPSIVTDGVIPLTTLMRQSIAEQRLLAQVSAGFGLLALLLAAIGLYGVMTYAVTRRTGELGLRIALGAEPARLIRMVVGDAFRPVAAGALIGAPLAWAASRALESQTRTAGVDWIAVGVSAGILALAALVAALFPALRASRVEPLTALRQQ
jgi:predicted permease